MGLLVGVVALAGVGLLSLAVGSRELSLSTVMEALTGAGQTPDDLIVRTLRLPRTELGLLVGIALGIAGVLIQGVTRNPLADPGLLGIEAGAALAVVVGLHVFGMARLHDLIWFAMAGAALAGALVQLLGAAGPGGPTPVRLVIAGAAVSVLLGSLTSTVLVIDTHTDAPFRFWAVGSLAGRDPSIATDAAPLIIGGMIVAVALGRALDTLALGDDMARGLGQHVTLIRTVALGAVVVLAGVATAAAGPIAFLGLAVPHIARAWVGPSQRWTIVYALVLGPLILLIADLIARVAVRPGELPVGVITPFIGAPVLVPLVRRRHLVRA